MTGVDLLDDLRDFFRSLGGLLGRLPRTRRGRQALLADAATAFIVVTSPEREPVDEAIFFGRASCATPGCRSAASSSTACTRDRCSDRRRRRELLARKVARTVAEVDLLAGATPPRSRD